MGFSKAEHRSSGTQKETAGTVAQTHEQTKLSQVAHKAMKVRQLRFKLGKKLHKKEKAKEFANWLCLFDIIFK
ncbi:hypothetical protein Tco_1065868 [Tanacetum coccineum]